MIDFIIYIIGVGFAIGALLAVMAVVWFELDYRYYESKKQ